MFDKSDRRFFRGSNLNEVIEPIQRALHSQHGIFLAPMNATMLSGRSEDTSYGLHPKVTVICMPAPEGFQVNVQLTCDLGTTGIVIAIITYMFCFPFGLLMLYLAHRDITQRQDMMLAGMWGSVQHLIAAPVYALQPQAPYGFR